MSAVRWSDNDALFRELLSSGYAWQSLPLAFLLASGFQVEMPALSVRESIDQAEQWRETADLIVRIGVKPRVIQVKSRPFFFTSPNDWPKNRLPAFVDTVKKWDAQRIKPYAYVFVSQQTGAMVATAATKPAQRRWVRVPARDSVRDIQETFYAVAADYLVSMSVLVKALAATAGHAAMVERVK